MQVQVSGETRFCLRAAVLTKLLTQAVRVFVCVSADVWESVKNWPTISPPVGRRAR